MKRLFYIFLLLAVVACSHDEDNALVSVFEPSPIIFGNLTKGNVEWIDGRSDTRADNEISSVMPDDIGVFAFGDGQNTTYVFNNQQVFFKNGEGVKKQGWWKEPSATSGGNDYWPYLQNDDASSTGTTLNLWPYSTDKTTVVPRYWAVMNYRFFAYSPWFPDADVSVTAENFSGFNSFTWNNVPGFSDKDFVLANEIQQVEITDEELDLTKDPYRTQGDLTKDKVVKFRMRHILSRIRFFFKMSKEYRELREIKLNSLTILSAGKVKTATFNFKNNTWDETVHWSNEQTGDADPVTLYGDNSDNFIPALEVGEWPEDPFASVYVYPQSGFSEIKFKVNYTTYDSEGVETREAELTNTVSLPNWTLLAGYYYDIKINIFPDFLYVLSDNDQDFDGYVIIKESGGN